MIFWQALIVSLLVSGSLARHYDVGSDCQSVYESLNTLLLNFPKNYGFQFNASNILYNNPKFYLKLPLRIGHEGCHAQVTQNEHGKNLTVMISGILSGKLEVKVGLVKLEDMHVKFVLKVDPINEKIANVTEISMNIDYISKVYWEEGYTTQDITASWDQIIASVITKDLNEYLKKIEVDVSKYQVIMLGITDIINYTAIMEYWLQQEFGYAIGILN